MLRNNLPQVKQLAIMHIYHLTVAMVHESGHSISGSCASWFVSQGWSRVYSLTWSFNRERSTCQAHSVLVSSLQFLPGCWAKDLNSMLAIGHRFLISSSHMPLPYSSLLHQSVRPRGQQKRFSSKMEVTVFCNWITEVTAHHPAIAIA